MMARIEDSEEVSALVGYTDADDHDDADAHAYPLRSRSSPSKYRRSISSLSNAQIVLLTAGVLVFGVLVGRFAFQSEDSKGGAKGNAEPQSGPPFVTPGKKGSKPREKTSVDNPIPPLSDLVEGTKIKGDVSWMLDFAVVDYPKCGTTFLMNYIRKSKEAYLNEGEVCSMDRQRPYKIVNRYYPLLEKKRRTKDGRKIKYGLKCPEELETEFALSHYAEYFPNTNFIVTLRHPVLWFQSYYNFRAYNSFPLIMPHTDELIGYCMPGYEYVPWNCSHHCSSGNEKVCTSRAKFHHTLSRLGKTPMSTPEEKALLQHSMKVVPTKNKIFLMENRQIILENPASKHFAEDLRDFLGLEEDLPALKHFEKKPTRYSNKEAYSHRIDICEDQHKKARKELVEIGREAAQWITEYFLKSKDVVVTSRERFIELINDWGKDPCEEEIK